MCATYQALAHGGSKLDIVLEKEELALINHHLVKPELSSTFLLTGVHDRQVPAHWSYPMHEHHYFELNLLEFGEQDYSLPHQTLHQKPGDVVLITPFQSHRASTHVPSRFYCIHFNVDDVELRQALLQLGSHRLSATDPLTQQLRPIIKKIAAVANDHDSSPLVWRLKTSAALFTMLQLLLQCAELVQQSDSVRTSPAGRVMAQGLAALIEQEIALEKTETPIESAVRQLGYAPDYGNAVFRQCFGVSAQQYRSTLKLRRARLLLMDDRLTISAISELLGYTDGAHFSRQFKRWTGMSPNAYRQTLSKLN